MSTLARVRTDPTLSPREFLARRLGVPPPLDDAKATFWFSGRVALFQAVRALGLRPGDGVALPAYCCGSEVEPMLHAGLTPRFYCLRDDLAPDPGSFATAVREARVALAIHYFGFAAPLAGAREACREAGIPLIEDCAHALYSRDADGDWLGARADVAIFSIGKTIPVPDGGALLLNRHAADTPAAGTTPPGTLIGRRAARLVIRHLQAHRHRAVSGAARIPGSLRSALRLRATDPDRETQAGLSTISALDPALVDAGMSRMSARLLARAPHSQIRSTRRRNYLRLEEALRGVPGLRPLFPSLPEETCPLLLPVLADDPAEFRQRLAATPDLGVQHIWPWFHPAVRWEDFPAEAGLKDRVFNIPIHHTLSGREIERLVSGIERWKSA